jgi:pectinesterase
MRKVLAAISAGVLCVAANLTARERPVAPIRIVLVGDSTVTDDSGWGRGFKQLAGPDIDVQNTAANGRSSKSFLDEGRWRGALALKGQYYLIQFGHNDEPGKGPERETDPKTTYFQNMAKYVDEARAIGATPVLVTSLVRRTFDPSGKIRSSQTAYVEAVRRLASEKHVPLVDLFARSSALSEQMGAAALVPYSAKTADGGVDTTHLNAQGSLLFGRLVVDDLRRVVPALAPAFRTDAGGAQTIRMERQVDAIVAADGTGQYTTIQEAINAVPQNTSAARRWVILVKPGTYREVVYVQREKRFVTLTGEDPARTTVVFNLKASDVGLDGKPIGTFRTPTMTIDADDFSIENLTIANDAGPVGQALALRVDGDREVFRNSRFLGWQDTIFLDRGRQYFEDSFIGGHVDFIFGGSTAFFERCHLHAWGNGYFTAASTPPEASYGFVFANGIITGDAEVRSYLGRPWRDYAQVTFLNTMMGEVVRPAGWNNWDRPEREKTSRYSEFGTTGPGSLNRVPWARALTAAEAAEMTIDRVLGGADAWNPRAVTPFPSATRANAAPLPAAPGPRPTGGTPQTPGAPASASVSWDQAQRQPAAWYASADAQRIAENVRAYQRHTGGWPKNIDMARPQSGADRARLATEARQDDSTIDNGATVTQLRYLSRVFAAGHDAGASDAFLKGIDFLLAAQYSNGGWPQYFPLREDYSRHITFNDDAMIGVMTLLDDVAVGRAPVDFVDAARRRKAADAVERGRAIILKTQIRAGGKLTGWCQQHDATTLAPAKARTYEHPSTSGRETVAIVRYLMSIEKPDKATIAAIEGAVAWLEKVQIRGLRVERRPDPAGPGGYDAVAVDDPGAPALWARFYELGTDRPIFSGRDGVIKYKLAEIEIERRTGYSWLGPYAAGLLGTEYPAWKKKH